MREPQPIPHQSGQLPGITPACAGTTLRQAGRFLPEQDHPRVCGNHINPCSREPTESGSPPRVREPLREPAKWKHSSRITPACAGTTVGSTRSNSMMRDHPRVCGNHTLTTISGYMGAGSPPRVREPHFFAGDKLVQMGITPACAGTTRIRQIRMRQLWDHPRVCGNHG